MTLFWSSNKLRRLVSDNIMTALCMTYTTETAPEQVARTSHLDFCLSMSNSASFSAIIALRRSISCSIFASSRQVIPTYRLLPPNIEDFDGRHNVVNHGIH